MAQRPHPSLRFADGGIVPGKGRGDKIPAKYEPGEFVVSNDMIADNPGLREQLSGLRAETLAARGKTVEEADAQVLNGGRRPSLRADQGFDPISRMARDLTGQNSLPPKPPVGNMADDLVRNARAAPPAPPAGPANPGMANPQAQAAYDDMARAKAQPTAPTVEPAAPKAPGAAPKWIGSGEDWKKMVQGAPDSPHKTLRMTTPEAPRGLGKGLLALQGVMGAKDAYDGIQEGDGWKAGVGAADAVAGAALFTPAAPVAGAYLGARGAWDTGKAVGGAIYDYVLSDKAKDVVGGTFNQIGLNTGLWGEDDSAKLMADAQARLANPADTLRKTAPGAAPADDRNPYAAANAAKIAAADAQNKAAPTTPGDIRRIDRPGASPLFTNMPDGGQFGNDTLMARGQISAQNMAAADNLAASNDITPRLRAQTQYDAEVANAQRINDMQQRMNGAGSKAAMPDLRSPEYLAARNASVTSTISRDGRPRLRSEVEAETARIKMAQDARIEQMRDQTTQRGQELVADASRYSSDNSLRGTMYSADSQLGAKRTEMERSLRQQQLTGKLWEMSQGKPEVFRGLAMQAGLTDAAKLGGDMAASDQTRTLKNVEDARDTFKDLFTTPDGKTDKNAEANAHIMAAKIVPGWENMSAEQRAANRTKVIDAVKLVQGMNATKDTSWLQKIGLGSPNGAYSQLPELVNKDGKRAQVGEVDWWEGMTTPNVSRGDTVITLPNGTKRYLRGQLEESQAALLEQNGAQRQR